MAAFIKDGILCLQRLHLYNNEWIGRNGEVDSYFDNHKVLGINGLGRIGKLVLWHNLSEIGRAHV